MESVLGKQDRGTPQTMQAKKCKIVRRRTFKIKIRRLCFGQFKGLCLWSDKKSVFNF